MQINSASNNPKIKAVEAPLASYLRARFQIRSLRSKLPSLTEEDRSVVSAKISSLILRSNKDFDVISALLASFPSYDTMVNYGGSSMYLNQVPIDIPYPVKYAYYLVYGFDVERILSDMNMEILTYFNLKLCKDEVGKTYDIPWDLVDAYKDNVELYTRIVTAYTNSHGNEFNLYNRWPTYVETGKTIPKVKHTKDRESIFAARLKEANDTLSKHRKAVSDVDLEVQTFVRRTTIPKLRGVVKGQAEETYKDMQERLFGKQEV